jgi:uncharacterized membrane protein
MIIYLTLGREIEISKKGSFDWAERGLSLTFFHSTLLYTSTFKIEEVVKSSLHLTRNI